MNVVVLQERLRNNKDDIIKILLKLGFEEDKIKYNARDNRISSTRPEEGADNANGFVIYLDSCNWFYTTRNGKGNIFTLVMDLKHVSFPKALELIARWLDIKEDFKIKFPFHGFYRSIEKEKTYPELTMKKYKKEDLGDADGVSQKFFEDGVDFITQEFFGVTYDHDDDAVLIPIHDYNGSLVGCKARNNDPKCDMSQRWWAKLPYAKSYILYGYVENYQSIISKQTVIIFEAEKSVMQCRSFGCYVAVAIGGHSISDTQVRYIKSLMCKNVIVAFDEGIDEEELRFECKKLISNKSTVYYIYDGDHEVLKEGSKDSPSDNGVDAFKKLLNKRKQLNGS